MERMYRTFTATQLGVLDDLANHPGARETFFSVSADYTLSHDKLSCDDVFCMLIWSHSHVRVAVYTNYITVEF